LTAPEAADPLQPILLAVIPVFFVILLGAGLRYIRFPGDGFWEPLNRINYFLFFPALLIHVLARADFHGGGVLPLVGATAFGVIALSSLLILARPLIRVDGPAFTSVFQGAVRQNTFIGLAAASSLYGASGLAMSAVLLAGYVPIVNPISISVLVRYGSRRQGGGLRRMVGEIVRNPIPIACAVGLLLNLTGIGLPFGTEPFLGILGQASLALGLLAAGAGLEAMPVRRLGWPALIASVAKLAVLPVLIWLPLKLAGITGLPVAIGVLFGALPSAAGSYVLAAVLGGDATLMAAILVVETALAVVTIPAALLLLT
jgi:malonate transporter